MVRGISVVLAVGLVVLWIVALGQHATVWLAWLALIGGLCGFGIALGAGDPAGRMMGVGAPIALAIGLFVLWIIGLATRANTWLTWWDFAFACAFLLVGIIFGAAGPRLTTTTTTRTTPPHPV